MKFFVQLGNLLVEIPMVQRLRVFEERKNYTSNLWQVNPDSIGTFFILEKVLRIRECWRHPWVMNDSKSSPSFFVQKSLIYLCSLIDTRWAQNFDCLK